MPCGPGTRPITLMLLAAGAIAALQQVSCDIASSAAPLATLAAQQRELVEKMGGEREVRLLCMRREAASASPSLEWR